MSRDTRSCPQCGGVFTVYASRTKRFCSRDCSTLAQQVRKSVTCASCGVEFTVPTSRRRSHCSVSCKAASQRKALLVGKYRQVHLPGHPLAGSSGLVSEHRVLLYAKIGPGKHPCYRCGRSVEWRVGGGIGDGVLVVDHIDRDSRNNSVANLAPACTRCNNLNMSSTVEADEPHIVQKDGTRVRGFQRDCEQCGKAFVAWPNKKDPRRGRFCSHSCSVRARTRDTHGRLRQ